MRHPVCRGGMVEVVIVLATVLLACWGGSAALGADVLAQPSELSQSQSPQGRGGGARGGGVYKARIEPHWFAENRRFWYRNDLRGDRREFIVVDVESATRAPAFDHERLAASLSEALGRTVAADRLPFETIEWDASGKTIRFDAGGGQWSCDLETYTCERLGDAQDEPEGREPRFGFGRGRRGGGTGRGGGRFGRDADRSESPDGRWTASIDSGNIVLRERNGDETRRLTSNGSEDRPYGMLNWSPDSKTLVAFRIEPGDRHEVYRIESSPPGGGRAILHQRPYALPGDRFTSYELHLFDVAEGSSRKPDVDVIDFGQPRLRWLPDGRHFAYQQVDRGHQRFRVVSVDAKTGDSFNIIDEVSETFIWTAHKENVGLELVNWLENTEEIIYASERDGWRHLYLVDARNGGIKNQITSGEFVVRGIDRIDEEARQVWFHASGMYPDQDPYFVHYYRINFDGTGLVALTEGNGNHSIQYSPDRKYLIDTYSRVDMPPVHELRRVADGSFVCRLEQADISELEERGAVFPEVFVAKGRDGATDIWGIICRPPDFDPNRKYPIIEQIYAGPQGAFVPKSFVGGNRFADLTRLGFIVVQIDGMGTAHRSKAFHDVCWKNLKDGGFPDRIRWIKAAAEKYPYMDTSRVGIYGTSAGGQNAAAAVLFHNDFYKAAVANCGCHDNRMDKASWNEQWMGYPVGPQYSECSNIDNAYRLEGHLMLVVGEMDDNVPPESTLRFVDALIKADKDFEFLFVPGGGHGVGSARSYYTRRMHDFFVRHLLGTGPSSPPGQAETIAAAAQGDGEREAETRTDDQPNRGTSAEPLDLMAIEPEDDPVSRIRDRYQADLGSLERFYFVQEAPQARNRMREFYVDWLAALLHLDTSAWHEADRNNLEQLKDDITAALVEHEEGARRADRMAELVPFAPAIYGLVESKLYAQRVNAPEAAGVLADAARQVKALIDSLNEQPASDTSDTASDVSNSASDAPDSAADGQNSASDRPARRDAAQFVQRLERYLRTWYEFYNGYDPEFTWWMRAPYDELREGLGRYATRLEDGDSSAAEESDGRAPSPTAGGPASEPIAETEPQTVIISQSRHAAASSPTAALPIRVAGSDVPDLAELVALKPTRMEAVIEKFQSELPRRRGGRGRGGRGPAAGRGAVARGSANAGRSREDVVGEAARGQAAEVAQQDEREAGEGETRPSESAEREAAEQAVGSSGNNSERAAAGDSGGNADADAARRGGRGGRGGGGAAAARAAQRRVFERWQQALGEMDFASLSQSDRVDYLLLRNHIEHRLRQLEREAQQANQERPRPVDASGIAGRPIGRQALLEDLAHEMIAYSPEELIAIAQQEYAWCQAELRKAAREMGFGDDWRAAVEKVKTMHVAPGEQPELIRNLAWEAIDFLLEHDLVSVPPLAAETWRMDMMSPERQRVNPFFTGGPTITVSFPTDSMSHEDKLQSMRGNNIPFARATVHHELIPGHNLQAYMTGRYKTYRRMFATPFWGEGWALYWEMLLYEMGFPKTPEDRVGFLVWRQHRCARIVFSLGYHLGQMTPQQCIDYLVENVGFERKNSEAEVRRSFESSYAPLYQAAYMLGGLQFRRLHRELVGSGKMTNREFHDRILREGSIPVVMVRAILTGEPLEKEGPPKWRFYDVPAEQQVRAEAAAGAQR